MKGILAGPILTAGLLCVAFAGAALASERVALVIGNGSYSRVSELSSPVKDANLMSNALRDVGFDVVHGVDMTKENMEAAIIDFGERLRQAGPDAEGLFYCCATLMLFRPWRAVKGGQLFDSSRCADRGGKPPQYQGGTCMVGTRADGGCEEQVEPGDSRCLPEQSLRRHEEHRQGRAAGSGGAHGHPDRLCRGARQGGIRRSRKELALLPLYGGLGSDDGSTRSAGRGRPQAGSQIGSGRDGKPAATVVGKFAGRELFVSVIGF